MQPIQRSEQNGTLRLTWDNRTAPKDRCVFWSLVPFWVVWAPLTLAATAALIAGVAPCFFAIWCVFGWLGTLGIPYTLLMRRWCEWVELSAENLTLGATGLLAPRPKKYALDAGIEITLGWYHDGFEHESMPTLNVVHGIGSGFRWRTLFGYWLTPPLKREVFDAIKAFVEANGIPVKLSVYGAQPGALPDAGRR